MIPPGNTGYVNSNMYPDDSGQGNVAMCKSDLAKAGYPNGVTLTYTVPERLLRHPDLHRDPGVAGELRHHADR